MTRFEVDDEIDDEDEEDDEDEDDEEDDEDEDEDAEEPETWKVWPDGLIHSKDCLCLTSRNETA
ncbi:MAG: hypothetical protein HY655_02225 [Acidobacteria bacterium]|nr:hypothetical protein [Acidobacteriota bacterium]